MTMPVEAPVEVQTSPMSMATMPAEAPEAAPVPDALSEFSAQLDEQMRTAAEAAWKAAPASARAEHKRAVAADRSLLGPNVEARLQDQMDVGEIAANAERDIEAEEAGDSGTAESVDQDDGEADGDGTAASTDAAVARQIAAQAQAELNAIRASDQHILTQLAEISGFVGEANGRTRFENLSERVVKGIASRSEQQECAEMSQWQDLAKPIYRAAEVHVQAQFSQGIANAFTTPLTAAVQAGGLTQEEARAVYYASPAQLAELAIEGMQARSQSRPASSGTSRPSAPAKPRTAAPAQPSRVRFNTPDDSGGVIGPRTPSPSEAALAAWLKGALDPVTGLPSDEADAQVKRGLLLG